MVLTTGISHKARQPPIGTAVVRLLLTGMSDVGFLCYFRGDGALVDHYAQSLLKEIGH